MSPKLLRDARVYGVFFRIDQDLAAETRSGGCACGGRLHAADYPRKPRGGPERLGAEYGSRFSFCCDREGCRRRSTPPSVRFLGRRIYLAAVVVLIAALAHGARATRLRRLGRLVGDVSRRTVERWRQWWREAFPESALWRELCGRFMPVVATDALPRSLLERMPGADEQSRLVAVLRLLAPITTATTGPPARGP